LRERTIRKKEGKKKKMRDEGEEVKVRDKNF
jgi:hypothetical protein